MRSIKSEMIIKRFHFVLVVSYARLFYFFSSTVGPAYAGVVGESGKKLRNHKRNNLEATFILLTMQVDRKTRQFKCRSRL